MIEFQANGEPTRFTGAYQSYRTSVGHKVVVRYDPKRPAVSARVVDPFGMLGVWGASAMGGLSIAASLKTLLPVPKWLSSKGL